jgi:hypothetical protein
MDTYISEEEKDAANKLIEFLSGLPVEKREPMKVIIELLANAKEIARRENFNLFTFVDSKYSKVGSMSAVAANHVMNDVETTAGLTPIIMAKIADLNSDKRIQLAVLELIDEIKETQPDEQCDCSVCTAEREAQNNATKH